MFVDHMKQGDKVAVVSFNQGATVKFPLTTIGSNRVVHAAAKSAINTIRATGSTSIGAGLAAASNQLRNIDPNNPHNVMVLLSDGAENTSPYFSSVLPDLLDPSKIRVFTIAHGCQGVDAILLNTIAAYTGGEYFRSPSKDTLAEIYYNITVILAGGNTAQTSRGNIQQGHTNGHYVTVDSSMSDVDFTCMWQGSDIDVVLVPPSGGEINPAVAAANDDIDYIEGETYEFYRIAEPESGNWQVRATGMDIEPEGEPYTVAVSGYSPLGLSIVFNKHEYFPTHPMRIVAEISDPEPVPGATVTAVMTTPSATHNLTLYSALKRIRKPRQKLRGNFTDNLTHG
jgi:hypothetical protein